jgi:hypothetical protein
MKKLLKNVLWDYQLTEEEVERIYRGDLALGGMDETKLKARLLNTYNWYTLVRELGFKEARALLRPDIIRFLYPKALQESYAYAARVLHH